MVDDYKHQDGSFPVVKLAVTPPMLRAQTCNGRADGLRDLQEDEPSSAGSSCITRVPLHPSSDARYCHGSAPVDRQEDVPFGGTAVLEGDADGSRHKALHGDVRSRSRKGEASCRGVGGSRSFHDAGGRVGGAY